MKRVIRQRVWTGDKASARSVGENLRDVESAVTQMVPIRKVTLDNLVYTTDGVAIEADSEPWAVICVLVRRIDGSWIVSSTSADFAYSQGTIKAKFLGLTNGARYATIRLLVIG